MSKGTITDVMEAPTILVEGRPSPKHVEIVIRRDAFEPKTVSLEIRCDGATVALIGQVPRVTVNRDDLAGEQ